MPRILLVLVTLSGYLVMIIPRLAREVSRHLLGRAALKRCRTEDIPATLQALHFDHDAFDSKILAP